MGFTYINEGGGKLINNLISDFMGNVWIVVLIRSVVAVLIGGLIGSERARHG